MKPLKKAAKVAKPAKAPKAVRAKKPEAPAPVAQPINAPPVPKKRGPKPKMKVLGEKLGPDIIESFLPEDTAEVRVRLPETFASPTAPISEQMRAHLLGVAEQLCNLAHDHETYAATLRKQSLEITMLVPAFTAEIAAAIVPPPLSAEQTAALAAGGDDDDGV